MEAGNDSEFHPVLLFDGVCNLCHGSVRFVIRRDPGALFRFASLQSTLGQRMAAAHGIDASALQSFVLVEHGRAYTRSTAALRVARRLRWPWPAAYALMAVPRIIRDAAYDFVGNRRYRWFGMRTYCEISVPGESQRFLAGDEC